MKESNIDNQSKKNVSITKNEKSRIRFDIQKNDKEESDEIYDILRMSEFMNEHLRDLKYVTLKDGEKGMNEKNAEINYDHLEMIKDFRREKLLDNNLFFYNGKDFKKAENQEIFKADKSNTNVNTAKNLLFFNLNPITKCRIDYSDDEVEKNNSDIDIYLDE